ncbi:hypothetical protein NKH18_01520 [Streptomyces sp. M10(2022)]
MFEHGVTRAGPLRIPARPHLALEFLEEVRTTIQHYGVEVEGLPTTATVSTTTATSPARIAASRPEVADLAHRIRAIEHRVGFRIIDRDTRPSPHTRGRDFLREAQQILRIADAAEPGRPDPP